MVPALGIFIFEWTKLGKMPKIEYGWFSLVGILCTAVVFGTDITPTSCSREIRVSNLKKPRRFYSENRRHSCKGWVMQIAIDGFVGRRAGHLDEH